MSKPVFLTHSSQSDSLRELSSILRSSISPKSQTSFGTRITDLEDSKFTDLEELEENLMLLAKGKEKALGILSEIPNNILENTGDDLLKSSLSFACVANDKELLTVFLSKIKLDLLFNDNDFRLELLNSAANTRSHNTIEVLLNPPYSFDVNLRKGFLGKDAFTTAAEQGYIKRPNLDNYAGRRDDYMGDVAKYEKERMIFSYIIRNKKLLGLEDEDLGNFTLWAIDVDGGIRIRELASSFVPSLARDDAGIPLSFRMVFSNRDRMQDLVDRYDGDKSKVGIALNRIYNTGISLAISEGIMETGAATKSGRIASEIAPSPDATSATVKKDTNCCSVQ